MDRVKIALNLRKPGNYAFFCPVSRLHLTRSNPVGYADGVTSAILMGLMSKSLLDVDGVVDLKTGKTKEKAADSNKEEIKTDEIQEHEEQPVDASEDPNTEENEDSDEEQVEEKEVESEASDDATEATETPKKRGRKAK